MPVSDGFYYVSLVILLFYNHGPTPLVYFFFNVLMPYGIIGLLAWKHSPPISDSFTHSQNSGGPRVASGMRVIC